jgi:RNA polymerase sigma-70 factor (ECF subfamily)
MSRSSSFVVAVDDEVVAEARRGDNAALERLFRLFACPVFTLATRLTGSSDEAEEVLQETFLELMRSVGRFRGDGPFGAWVRRIVVSKVLMSRRRSRVRRTEGRWSGVEPVDPSSRWSDRPWRIKRDVERALCRLPETARVVVWLHDVEGMTHAEIARLFDRSPSFSKSQLSRAHDKLRGWLDAEGRDHRASIDGDAVGAARR